MNEHGHRKPTPPSEAPGEGGDKEAREEAENAVVPGSRGREDTDKLSPETDTDADGDTDGRDEHHTKRSE
ncbi:hypothetical protein [Streptomyces fagopyri]|uniref:hypothetical protein n=1 Tax=Streptomyces fagopyri TaxID=2662397 RepID=UPI0033DAE7B2